MIWFTADTHFYHRNVIRYCKRPFLNLETMHDALVINWHDRVKDGDTVYILGDFAFCGVERGKEIVRALRGDKAIHIVLIRGNHDQNEARCLKMDFDEVYNELTLYWAGRKFNLSHYPYAPTPRQIFWNKLRNFWKVWRRKKYMDLRYLDRRPFDDGRWLLHGHVHNAWHVRGRMINVGVDRNDYRPISFPEVAAIIRKVEGKDAAS